MADSINISPDLNVRAEYLSTEDLKLAASLLYQSYQNDPVFLEIFHGNKPDYEQRLRALIREELGAFSQAKQPMVGLYLDESLVGAACLNSPDEGFESDRFWHWRLKMMLSAGYFSTKQMIEKEKIIAQAVPFKSYHMLSLIAIHPLHQHHGLGHYLISAVNNMLEEHPSSEGIVVYATTDKYLNFFKDVGYQVIKEVKVGNVAGSLMAYKRTHKTAN
jgi:ribosomal protein S18 acetylase RimI-like enzyme